MPIFTDQIGETIDLKNVPERIVSLVPSQTELLFDLGLENKLVGRTKFCIHPASKVESIKRVGGTKNLNIETIKNLAPDLIIANKEENVFEQINELKSFCPVYTSDIKNMDDAFEMMRHIGAMMNVPQQAESLIQSILHSFSLLNNFEKIKVVYLIWQNPMMTVGSDTFINQLLEKAGMENVCADKIRYPEISVEEIKSSNADYILLSSEPFPFKEKQLMEFEKIFPTQKIVLVDGEMFSWYGSRMKFAAEYFLQLRKKI